MKKLPTEKRDSLIFKLSLIKTTFYQWTQTSTSHAIPNIFRTASNLIRIIWIICWLVCLGFCGQVLITSIQAYLKYDVNTQIQIIEANDGLALPAVLFCNYDLYPTPEGASYVLNEFVRISGYKDVTGLKYLIDKGYPEMRTQRDLGNLRETAFDPKYNETLKKSYGMSISNMLINCEIGGFKCNLSHFEWYLLFFYNILLIFLF
jgi:hypothetical protein